MWERASAHYDRQLWLERSAIRAALDLLAPLANERLLDVGTGTGEVLRQLTLRSGRPRRATGVDTSAAMLACVPALPVGWNIRRSDARRLPFHNGAFDVAVASYVLHVLPRADLPAALAELGRVLRPDGRLVTVTPAIPGRGAARLLALASDALAQRSPERYGGLRALDPRIALRQAGFVLLRARWSLRGYPSLLVLARAPHGDG
jgi:ubiquinone/menaquinone biosynthesis C-methylase UbiE